MALTTDAVGTESSSVLVELLRAAERRLYFRGVIEDGVIDLVFPRFFFEGYQRLETMTPKYFGRQITRSSLRGHPRRFDYSFYERKNHVI